MQSFMLVRAGSKARQTEDGCTETVDRMEATKDERTRRGTEQAEEQHAGEQAREHKAKLELIRQYTPMQIDLTLTHTYNSPNPGGTHLLP